MKRAVLIDALGTMLELEPPWENAGSEAFAGIPAERVREGFVAEMSYYMARTGEGRDRQSLADLRRRCARILSDGVGREIPVQAMMDAIRFRLYPETASALAGLRARGLRIVCVSNWDYSLPEALDRLGIADSLDGVVTSAGCGARKPDPAIFGVALELVGCEAAEALHVGDSDDDVTGGRAAGIEVLRIDRSGAGDIASLDEISEHLAD